MTTGLRGLPLSERQERVLRAVRNAPGEPTPAVARRTGLTAKQVMDALNALYVCRLVERVQLDPRHGAAWLWWPHKGPYGIGSPGASGAP